MPVLTPGGSFLSVASNPRRDDGDGRDDILGTPPVSKISSPSTQSSRSPCIPRPHDEIRRVQRGLSERISRVFLRQRTAVVALPFWESTAVRAVELRSGYRLQATAEASAEAAFPVPPRRAHDTLQPSDESIIVGYYTLKKCRSLRYPNLTAVYQQKGALWQETTGLTVP